MPLAESFNTISFDQISLIIAVVGALWGLVKATLWVSQKVSGKPSREDAHQDSLGAIRELVEAIKAQPSSQNLACGMQHGAISKTLDENTAGIRELVAALRDQIHTEELRYQNLNMKLEMIVEGQRALAARLDRK